MPWNAKAFEETTNTKVGTGVRSAGSIHQDSRNFEKAESYYLKSDRNSMHRAGLKSDLGYDYNSMPPYTSLSKNLDEALAYNLKAMAIRKETSRWKRTKPDYANMILIYKTKKDYTKALEYAQMALPIWRAQ